MDMHEIMQALYGIGLDGVIRTRHKGMMWSEAAIPGHSLYDRALAAAYLEGLWEAIDKKEKRE